MYSCLLRRDEYIHVHNDDLDLTQLSEAPWRMFARHPDIKIEDDPSMGEIAIHFRTHAHITRPCDAKYQKPPPICCLGSRSI